MRLVTIETKTSPMELLEGCRLYQLTKMSATSSMGLSKLPAGLPASTDCAMSSVASPFFQRISLKTDKLMQVVGVETLGEKVAG